VITDRQKKVEKDEALGLSNLHCLRRGKKRRLSHKMAGVKDKGNRESGGIDHARKGQLPVCSPGSEGVHKIVKQSRHGAKRGKGNEERERGGGPLFLGVNYGEGKGAKILGGRLKALPGGRGSTGEGPWRPMGGPKPIY